jgi:hypothetical protein
MPQDTLKVYWTIFSYQNKRKLCAQQTLKTLLYLPCK